MFTPSAESSSGSTVWDQRVIGAVWKDADVLLTCATNRLRLLGIGRPDIDIVRGLFYKQIKMSGTSAHALSAHRPWLTLAAYRLSAVGGADIDVVCSLLFKQ